MTEPTFFRSLLDQISAYRSAVDVVHSMLSSPRLGAPAATTISICDQPGVLRLITAGDLVGYVREVCSTAVQANSVDMLVVDLQDERTSVDAFDAVVLAFANSGRSKSASYIRNAEFLAWRSYLQDHIQALRGVSRTELQRHRDVMAARALLIVRGIDSKQSESVEARVASATAAAEALGFTSILFIATSEALAVERCVWVHVTPEEFESITDAVLQQLAPVEAPEVIRQPTPSHSLPDGFWEQLKRLSNISSSRGTNGTGKDDASADRADFESIADEDAKRRARGLIAAATFPSVVNLARAAQRYQALTQLWEQAFRQREPAGSGTALPQQRLRPVPGQQLQRERENDRDASRESLLRAIFLAMLEIVRPELMHAVNIDPVGWQQLFRLQLLFSRLGSSERLLLGMNNRRWDVFLDDAQLRAFFWRAMGIVEATRPLVEPFASATALRRHFRMMLTGVSDDEKGRQEHWKQTMLELRSVLADAEDCLKRAKQATRDCKARREEFDQASKDLIAVARASNRENVDSVLAAVRTLVDREQRQQLAIEESTKAQCAAEELAGPLTRLAVVVLGGVTAQLPSFPRATLMALGTDASAGRFELLDAVEQGLRIVGLLELILGPGDSIDFRKNDLSEIETAAERADMVFREAAQDVDDSLAADALVGRARLTLALGRCGIGTEKASQFDVASRALDLAEARVQNDKLGRLAVRLGRALLYEFQGLSPKAAELAREVIPVSEEIGARELTARAVSLALRCDTASYRKPSWRQLARAQAFVDVQSARSPLISDLASELRNKLFVSYRTETRSFAQYLVEIAAEADPLQMAIWVDYLTIDPNADDFREAMQLGLDRSGLVLLVLSPGYFRSHWCSYELATTLARRRTTGLRMEWIAASMEDLATSETPKEYAQRLASLAAFTSEDRRYLESQVQQVVCQPPLVDRVVRIVPAKKGDGKKDDPDYARRMEEYDDVIVELKRRHTDGTPSKARDGAKLSTGG